METKRRKGEKEEKGEMTICEGEACNNRPPKKKCVSPHMVHGGEKEETKK
jgi:hypothetical protein